MFGRKLGQFIQDEATLLDGAHKAGTFIVSYEIVTDSLFDLLSSLLKLSAKGLLTLVILDALATAGWKDRSARSDAPALTLEPGSLGRLLGCHRPRSGCDDASHHGQHRQNGRR